ncbi:MAG: hypothetical protein R3C14_22695 [Caldilineaceae bacterium]
MLNDTRVLMLGIIGLVFLSAIAVRLVRSEGVRADSNIQNSIAAGLASVQIPPTAQPTDAPLPVFNSTNADTVNQWANTSWLAVTYNDDGSKWVWADGWYNCLWVALDGSGYSRPYEDQYRDFPDSWDWMQLGAVNQRSIKELCHGQ